MYRPTIIIPITAALLACVAFASPLAFAVDSSVAAQPQSTIELPADTDSIYIVSVEYVGNKVTRDSLLNQQLLFTAPVVVSGQQLADSVQNIRDLGLFESTTPILIPTAEGYRLQVTVDEKFYIIPLPRLGLNSDGETSYGASLEWDNIAGLNQRVKIVWERKQLQDATLGEKEVFRLNYDYPRVAGSLWNGGFFTNNSRVPVEETPAEGGRSYISEAQKHGVSLGRQLSEQGQTKGWFISTELFYLLEDNQPNLTVPELAGGRTWAVGFGADYRDRHLYSYSEEGVTYGFSGEISIPLNNADFSYNRLDWNWRRVKAGAGAHHSFIYRFGGGIYNGGIPERVGFSNSSNSLRGLKKGDLEGNALLHASAEYLLPIHHTIPSWRYGAFVDLAVFAGDYTEFCACDGSVSVGLALVWRPRKLVKVELRGEAGYNLDGKSVRGGGGLTRY